MTHIARSIIGAACLASACASTTSGRAPLEVPATPRSQWAQLVDALIDEAALADARVVAFGESTHGTFEFRELFFEAALTLAARHPELTIAREGTPGREWWLNEWIEGCGHTGRDATLPPVTDAELAFLERARRYNREGPGCVRLVSPDIAVNPYTLDMLHQLAPRCVGEEAYDPAIGRLIVELVSLQPTFGTDDDRPRLRLEEIEARLASPREGTHCVELDYWLQLARQHIRVPAGSLEGWLIPEYAEIVDRDQVMADNVAFWAEHGPVAFLAHAGHVTEVELPHLRGGGTTIPAGRHLHQRLGPDYLTVDLTFGEGRLSAIGCLSQRRMTSRRIPPPKHPSIEHDLHEDFDTPVAMSTAEACTQRECGLTRQYVYCLPRGFRDHPVSYSKLDLRRGFDWLVYLPQTTGFRWITPADPS